MKSIICYVRPWNEVQFQELLSEFYEYNIIYISDFLNSDYGILAEVFYKNYKSIKNYSLDDFFTEDEVNDIITRCRLLRCLDNNKSKKMIYSMWISIDEIFSDIKPEFGVGLTVDSYIIDLISIWLKRNNKQYYGIVVSFLNDRFRITTKGEFNKLWDPEDDIVDDFHYDLINKYSRPHFLPVINNSNDELLSAFKNSSLAHIRRYYYKFIYMLTKDNLNYHYLLNAKYSNKSFDLIPNYKEFNIDNYDEEDTYIYFPLQYYPEATIDYWVNSLDFIDYNKSLIDIISKFSELNVKVFIKEHPSSLGLRDKGFYNRLKIFSNVIFVPSYITSEILINKCRATFIWTGSAGAETIFRGKKVIHVGEPYYTYGNSFFHVKCLDDIELAIKWIYKDDKIDTYNFTKNLLSCTLYGKFKQPLKDGLRWSFNKKDIREVSKALFNYVKLH